MEASLFSQELLYGVTSFHRALKLPDPRRILPKLASLFHLTPQVEKTGRIESASHGGRHEVLPCLCRDAAFFHKRQPLRSIGQLFGAHLRISLSLAHGAHFLGTDAATDGLRQDFERARAAHRTKLLKPA